MTTFRAIALAAFAAFAIAAVTGPAGSASWPSCGSMMQIKDPGIRASFGKFEAQQSVTASKVCIAYSNAGQ
jgi:hypothetical protein